MNRIDITVLIDISNGVVKNNYIYIAESLIAMIFHVKFRLLILLYCPFTILIFIMLELNYE